MTRSTGVEVQWGLGKFTVSDRSESELIFYRILAMSSEGDSIFEKLRRSFFILSHNLIGIERGV